MSELSPQGTAIPIDLMMLVDGIRSRIKAGDVYEIAEGAGVTPPTLYEFIGNRRLPTIPTLQKLIHFFGITADAATHKQVQPSVVGMSLPQGWTLHPSDPRYAFKGQVVKLVCDVLRDIPPPSTEIQAVPMTKGNEDA